MATAAMGLSRRLLSVVATSRRAGLPLPLPRLQTAKRKEARCLHLWRPPRSAPRPRVAEQDGSDRSRRRQRSAGPLHLYAGIGLFSLLFSLTPARSDPSPDAPPPATGDDHNDHNDHNGRSDRDDRDPSLPRFRLADVRKHDAASGAPWVTSGDRVYDITDWVGAHPGGDVILRAAGRSIDPYWAIFTIHKADHVRQILDSYLIGFVDQADLDAHGRPVVSASDHVEDPFAQDPVRDPRLRVHTAKPCNAETPAAQLADAYTTPNELFYVRNHMWVPDEEVPGADGADGADGANGAGAYTLTVERPDGEERTYTLAELCARFPRHRITAVLQCSGNRRSDMTRAVGPTNGLQWAAGAIGNAVWEGVLLRDVLADAGVRGNGDADADADGTPLHVQMAGREAYAASIPLAVALDPRADVLLAFRMNGAPLPRDHGHPLRAIVPGHVAARSVKWLTRIVVADEEAPSQWQRRDYKLFGPNEGSHPDWARYPAIQEMPVTSAVTAVTVGGSSHDTKAAAADGRAPPGVHDPQAWRQQQQQRATQPTVPLVVAGYAYAGGGREIVRVDVSVDGGRTWDQAELLDPCGGAGAGADPGIVADGRKHWAWKRWRYRAAAALGPGAMVTADAGDAADTGNTTTPTDAACADILVKAVDSAYNTQPERHAGIYNVRGNLATAWHRVRVCRMRPARPGAAAVWDVSGCGFGSRPPRPAQAPPEDGIQNK